MSVYIIMRLENNGERLHKVVSSRIKADKYLETTVQRYINKGYLHQEILLERVAYNKAHRLTLPATNETINFVVYKAEVE